MLGCSEKGRDKRMEKSKIAPHVCPQCGSAAYIGAFDLECTWPKCDHYHAETAAAYGRERFPSVASIEDDPTQPQARIPIISIPGTLDMGGTQTGRWPAVAPAAVLPGTDQEVEDELKQAVAEAKADPKCTADDAKALDDWLADFLRDYVTAYGEKWIGTKVEAKRNSLDPTRLDISIQLTKIVPVTDIKVNLDGEIPMASFALQQKVKAYLDKMQEDFNQHSNVTGPGPDKPAYRNSLDAWAQLYAIAPRAPGETDTELRARLQEAYKGEWWPGASL